MTDSATGAPATTIRTCLTKYADFTGRASRPEYWWFVLFVVAGGVVVSMVSHTLGALFSLGTLVPSIAAATRRLHDTNRSGWWQLVSIVPVVGVIMLIVFLAQEGDSAAGTLGSSSTRY